MYAVSYQDSGNWTHYVGPFHRWYRAESCREMLEFYGVESPQIIELEHWSVAQAQVEADRGIV